MLRYRRRGDVDGRARRAWSRHRESHTRFQFRDRRRFSSSSFGSEPAVADSNLRASEAQGPCLHGTLRWVSTPSDKLPIKMLSDRLLVRIGKDDGERKSSGGILIPATAQMAKRLIWAEVVALGQNVRSAEVGDRVLFSPEDRYEIEVHGEDLVMLRERDIHAVAAERIEASTGLYL